jgi:glycosyltransferase involved in cell wall biosynthesis
MSAKHQRVLVIIPAYNEALSLPRVVDSLRSRYPNFDVLIVDDGSTDQTQSIMSKLPVKLLSLPCNLGVGGAVQTGLMVALEENYDVAIQVDGDGQHPPEEIDKLLTALEETGCDMVLGSRFLAMAGFQSTFSRRFGIRFFSSILSAICKTSITDATSGFRAWTRRAIELLARDYPEDYPEVEAILKVHQAGLRICEVPVQMMERTAGRSSIRTGQAIAYMIKVPLAILMNLLRKRETSASR